MSVAAPRPSVPPRHLEEIDGLRAVAALLVAAHHLWTGRVSGGVDVFLVVAAFFLTRSLLRLDDVHVAATARTHVSRRWAATLRRLAPLASVVVVATVVASVAFASRVTWPSELRHAVASVLYVENWHLITTSADYLDRSSAQSAFQQFWALSVQLQFALVWPVAVLGAWAVSTRTRWRFRACVAWLAGSVAVVSFAYATRAVQGGTQPAAYFHTGARAWELAVGALLAVAVDRPGPAGIPPSRARAWCATGWAALVVLVGFGIVVDASGAFPGPVALVPVLAACALLGASHHGCGPSVLRARWLVVLGGWSFAFYLWHWPILEIARHRGVGVGPDGETFGIVPGLAVIGAAGLLAWATTGGIEGPFRRLAGATRPGRRTMLAVAALQVPVVVALVLWQAVVAPAASSAGPGQLVPSPLAARDDLPDGYDNGCHQVFTGTDVRSCTYGDADGDIVVALVGGSHVLQWLPALEAATHGMQIHAVTKAGCHLADDLSGIVEMELPMHDSCETWAPSALGHVLELRPDVVVTIASRGNGVDEAVPGAYLRAWRTLEEAGIAVVAIRDNPWLPFDAPVCVSLHGRASSRCQVPRSEVLAGSLSLPDRPNVTYVDVSDELCDAQTCRVVVGDVLAYRDSDHLTATFVRDQAQRLEDALAAALAP